MVAAAQKSKWGSSVPRDTEYCQVSRGRLSYKQADTLIANEVWKLMRPAKCPPNVPGTLLLIVMCVLKKVQGQCLSWPILAGSRTASNRASVWEKPLGSVLELCFVWGSCCLWESRVARRRQQSCQCPCAATIVPADR